MSFNAWEWKMISKSKAEHLPSFWNRGPRELRNTLFSLEAKPTVCYNTHQHCRNTCHVTRPPLPICKETRILKLGKGRISTHRENVDKLYTVATKFNECCSLRLQLQKYFWFVTQKNVRLEGLRDDPKDRSGVQYLVYPRLQYIIYRVAWS